MKSTGIRSLGTVQCRYNVVIFLQNYHRRHPIARPWGRLLWLFTLMHVLLQSLLCWVQKSYNIGPRYNGTWLYIAVRSRGSSVVVWWSEDTLGPASISDKTSYRKISWSLNAARFVFGIVRSLWNLTGTLTALLPMCLPNFKVMR